jgi:hypothetical protein
MALRFVLIANILLIIFYCEKKRGRTYRWDCMHFYTWVYIITYVLPLLLVDQPFGLVDSIAQFHGLNPKSFVWTPLVVALGYFSVLFGFYFGKTHERRPVTERRLTLIVSRIQKLDRTIHWLAICLSLLAVAAFIIRANDYGGLSQFLRVRNLVRVYLADRVLGYSALLERLFPGAIVAYMMLLSEKVQKRSDRLFCFPPDLPFVIVLAIATFIAFTGGGRGSIIFIYILFPLLCITVLRDRLPVRLLSIGVPIFLLILLIGKPIFALMSGISIENQISGVFERFAFRYLGLTFIEQLQEIARNFQHRIFSVAIALEYVDSVDKLRWFLDIPLGIPALLPSNFEFFRLPESIQDFNTRVIFGNIGLDRTRIPPGWVAYAIYCLHIPGVFLYGLFTGLVGRFIENQLHPLARQHWFFMTAYLIFILIWVFYFQGGDWMNLYRNLIIELIVLLIALRLIRRKMRVGNRSYSRSHVWS